MATELFFTIIPLIAYGWFYRTCKDDGSDRKLVLPLVIIDSVIILFFTVIPFVDYVYQTIFVVINILLYRSVGNEIKSIGRPISSMSSVDRKKVHVAIKEDDFVTIANIGKYTRYDQMKL